MIEFTSVKNHLLHMRPSCRIASGKSRFIPQAAVARDGFYIARKGEGRTMEAKRVNEYHKHGCNFYGKLVVVNYYDEMQNDPKWGRWNSGIVYDYLEKARKIIAQRQYVVVRELLSMPELVVEIS